ncbi:MAG: hypothetical protein HUK22_06380, partial [Thermoguttaceae bacterium]|nr:hypothetical protein [Thermoguttaceae bacterium]
MTRSVIRFSAAFLVFSLGVTSVFAQDAGNATQTPPRALKVVYFTPADVEPLPGRAERLYRVMERVQRFYRDEMRRNGFGDMTFGLETTAPGALKLYEVRGAKNQREYGRDDAYPIRAEIAAALAESGLDVNKEVLVIFERLLAWEGERAIEVGPYCGVGLPQWGAAWVYDDALLDADSLGDKSPGGFYGRPCSVGEFNSHYVGGVAHELGHALTLPHDCELRAEAKLGRALMG